MARNYDVFTNCQLGPVNWEVGLCGEPGVPPAEAPARRGNRLSDYDYVYYEL